MDKHSRDTSYKEEQDAIRVCKAGISPNLSSQVLPEDMTPLLWPSYSPGLWAL